MIITVLYFIGLFMCVMSISCLYELDKRNNTDVVKYNVEKELVLVVAVTVFYPISLVGAGLVGLVFLIIKGLNRLSSKLVDLYELYRSNK